MSKAQDETKYVWHVTGGMSIPYVSVDRYTLKRETHNFWIVRTQSGERPFRKSDPWVFTNYAVMRDHLAQRKQKKLAETKCQVEILSNPISVGIHIIPSDLPGEPI